MGQPLSESSPATRVQLFGPPCILAQVEAKLAAYRQTRDQIQARMTDRFGPPTLPHDGDAAS